MMAPKLALGYKTFIERVKMFTLMIIKKQKFKQKKMHTKNAKNKKE